MDLRSLRSTVTRLKGDANAPRKGKAGRRTSRRSTGKTTGRGLGKLFR